MVKVFLIAGSTGAGKTTFAKKLEKETGSFRFSIDEWLATLFWDDQPDPLTFEWAQERTHRTESQICAVASKLLALETDVILDLGFMTRKQRTRFIDWAKSRGATPHLYYVAASQEIRHSRVRGRNENQGETYVIEITSPMFHFGEGIFDEPDPCECELFEVVQSE